MQDILSFDEVLRFCHFSSLYKLCLLYRQTRKEEIRLYILIANQDNATREAIRKTAEENGHTIIGEASSAGEAREMILRNGWPNVLVIDIMLPDLSGLALVEAIDKRKLPIAVIVTGKSSWHRHIRQAMRCGAIDYLLEPFEDAELIDALKQAMKQTESHYLLYRHIHLIKSFFEQLPEREPDVIMKEQSDLLSYIFNMQEKLQGERQGLLYMLSAKWQQVLTGHKISLKAAEAFESKLEAAIYFRRAAELWVARVKPQRGHEMPLLIKRACRYVHDNYFSVLTLEGICRSFDVSMSYFSKQFKEHTGMTFIQYVNHVRIEQAKELLLNSRLIISEAAAGCGFATMQHFNRAFKKETGMTPNEYRRRLGAACLEGMKA